MSEQSAEAEITPQALPKIEIDEFLKSEACPYTIEVDNEGVSKLLSLVGVKDEDIPKVSVHFKARPRELNMTYAQKLGDYDIDSKSINIYTSPVYNNQDTVAKAQAYLNQRDDESGAPKPKDKKNLFPKLTSGKRFTTYLRTIDKERGLKMAERLQNIKAGKEVQASLSHEIKHAGDDLTNQLNTGRDVKRRALAYGATAGAIALVGILESTITHGGIDAFSSAFLGTMSILGSAAMGKKTYYHFFNMDESRARSFAKDVSKDPKYKLVTFTAKQGSKPQPPNTGPLGFFKP